jgi:AMIN domain
MRRLALVVCLWAPAHADKVRIEPSAAPREGYQGVAPGKDALPPRPPPLPVKAGPQRLTWSGFQIKDGIPTVFVEVTAPPDYKIAEHKGGLVVTLKNTVVPLKNNRRPLRVGAFDTAVTSVEARPKGHDTEVRIATRDSGVPAHRERVEAAAGGFQLLVIELPPSK